MSECIYHFKPRGMIGEILIPLNELRISHPAAYSEHIKKYKGRESLLEARIPILDCLWNDVLHISPINPQIIIDSWRAEGLEKHSGFMGSLEVYRIPVELLSSATTVSYQSFNFDFSKKDPSLDKYFSFDPTTFKEQKAVSPHQLKIWQQDAQAGRRLFWFSHTMHVLAKQRIDTRACEIFTCQ